MCNSIDSKDNYIFLSRMKRQELGGHTMVAFISSEAINTDITPYPTPTFL